MSEKNHGQNDECLESSITRFVDYLHSYMDSYMKNNDNMETAHIIPQGVEVEEHVYELDGVRSQNSSIGGQINSPVKTQRSVTSTVEGSTEPLPARLDPSLDPDANDARSTITEPPPYQPQDKSRTASIDTRTTSEIQLPSHFFWTSNSFVGGQHSGLPNARRPSEGRFPDPVIEYEVHFPGRKRFIALAAMNILFITYLTLDLIATSMPRSQMYRKYFSYYVLNVLELVLTVLLAIITLYLLGGIVFHRPSNMQYASIKKATRKQKCIFLTLMAFAFTPLILACILTGLHKSANSQTVETEMISCRDMGYSTTVRLQAPSNSTTPMTGNATTSAIMSSGNETLRMTLSQVYKGLREDDDLYFKNVPNSIANITIHFVTGTRTFDIARKKSLPTGDIIADLMPGYYVEEPKLRFLNLPQPIYSEVLDWKYHTFTERPDLTLYMDATDSKPFIQVVPRTSGEDCTMLRICSTANITSTELLVPVGVILKELTKVAGACGLTHK